MNLSVNLILPSELRSASPVNLKSGLRILGIGALCVIAVYVGISLADIADLRARRVRADDRLRNKVRPAQEQEILRHKRDTEKTRFWQELEGLRVSRIDWNETLRRLPPLVPEEIQLLQLSVQHQFLPVSNSVSRSFQMTLKGRSAAEGAKTAVDAFLARIEASPAFAPLLAEKPGVQDIIEDARDRTDLTFEIVCKCLPRSL